MITFIYVLIGLALNFLFGGLMWAFADLNMDNRVFLWFTRCPKEIKWLAQPALVEFWPIAFYIRYRYES